MRQATGLLHFVGRRPSHVIKEMFFTAALIDAKPRSGCCSTT
jgi:hypothetical protein